MASSSISKAKVKEGKIEQQDMKDSSISLTIDFFNNYSYVYLNFDVHCASYNRYQISYSTGKTNTYFVDFIKRVVFSLVC
jgi:hypothetical protein